MQAVILAGGEGSRLRPLTLSRPKAMIPLANRPIIDYVIQALIENGIRDIIVVVGYRKEHVIRHLNRFDIPIRIVVQRKQLGPAHALRCAEAALSGDFILLPGDNYIDAASIGKIKKEPSSLLIKEHPYPSNFGVVSIREGFVTGIVEKPVYSPRVTVSTGIYHLKQDIFSYLLEGDEIPDAIVSMIADGYKFRAVPADQWHDAVYPWDLLGINSRVMKSGPPLKSGTIDGMSTIRGTVRVGEGTEIGPNSTILGPVIIGESCDIGPNTCIMPNTSIGSRVHIEPFTFLENSILMDDVRIGSHSRCVDAVVGEGARLANQTTIRTGNYRFEVDGKLLGGKFGAILGERVTSAPFTVLHHCIVGNYVSIEEGRTLSGTIQDHVVVK
ncbi:MAG TPA: nucleotidyl transferase [Methanoculleus sp.]|nr:nucleotidyl transferase [Methanoculleus sp.]